MGEPETRSTTDAHSHDGRLHCALCASRSTEEELLWCAVISSLICPHCCSGVIAFEPDRMVEALSHTEVAVTPDEITVICATCTIGRSTEHEGMSEA